MNNIPKNLFILETVLPILQGDILKATKYISPKEIIRATRTRVGGKIDKRYGMEITLTIGKPNFLEREFIKLCKKAGEPFPIKKVQFKTYQPKKRVVKRK